MNNEATSVYQGSSTLKRHLALLQTNGPPADEIMNGPLDSQFLMGRAIELSQQGDHTGAELAFRKLLADCAQSGSAYHNLAVCLIYQSRSREAESLLQDAIRIDPSYSRAYHALGNLLQREGKPDQGEFFLRRAHELEPTNAETLNDLAVALNDQRRFAEAKILLQQAIRINPEMADAHNNLGVSLTSLGEFRAAKRAIKRALRLRPTFAAAHSNLGSAYKESGKIVEALACYEMALRFDPENVSTRWNRSLALLQQGDFEQGWNEYEWRWRRPRTEPTFPNTAWNGESLEGRTIMLYAEQGLGDAIQFLRYGSSLRKSGARVIFRCPQPLLKLLEECQEFDDLVPEGLPLPTFDYHASLMSLPRLMKTTLASVPAKVPYVHANPDKCAKHKQWMDSASDPLKFRVGISWQGNPHHAWDQFRSIALHEWTPLAPISDVQYFSLQTGPGAEQAFQCQMPFQLISHPRGTDLGIEELAAIITNLDLVITVDTAIAHLAGALGVNVWIAIAAVSDWRWLQHRCDSPWYPTARLFRQRRVGNWFGVFSEMKQSLKFVRRNRVE